MAEELLEQYVVKGMKKKKEKLEIMHDQIKNMAFSNFFTLHSTALLSGEKGVKESLTPFPLLFNFFFSGLNRKYINPSLVDYYLLNLGFISDLPNEQKERAAASK